MTEPLPNAISNALEQLRHALASGAIDQTAFDLLAPAAMGARLDGAGAIAQGPAATAVGAQGVDIRGDHQGDITTGRRIDATAGTLVYAEQGATIVIGEAAVAMTAVDRQSTLGRYLQHLIAQNRYLQLQGIRSGGKLVNIELDRIYVSLRASRQSTRRAEVDWLAGEEALVPGERLRGQGDAPGAETAVVTVNQALAEHRRLVVLGDPGSGKTTLLRYLALLYARDLAQDQRLIDERLGLDEPGTLPILLPLRQIGRYLAEHRLRDDGTEGHAILLDLLIRVLRNERIELPPDFFDDWLHRGRAAVLLDGLDEVADPGLRRRVARLVDAFTRAYPDCRYCVTSRIVGYTDYSRLGEGYAIATVRDFSPDDIRVFLTQWHRLVAIGQMGPGESAEATATRQTEELLASIEASERVRELAINPLMLTVIALIHRDRVKLPDRRAELYQEAVDVLLGKWDEARGVPESLILNEGPFDIGDRRLVLQQLALAMQEQGLKEIDAGPLRALLAAQLRRDVAKPRELDASVTRFLQVIQERSGLLMARAEGTYAFSHLTFQEYLAALAIAGRDDYLDYSLARCPDPWWRETILLAAGALSTQSKEKTTRLIRAIADANQEPEPYHNLVLAAECLRDAGANRVLGDLETAIRGRLQRELERPVSRGRLGLVHTLFTRGTTPERAARRRIAAAEALGRIGGTRFWTRPYGEPEWVQIPAGPFIMGDAPRARRVELPDYAISRVPITNAQYLLFVQATDHEPPSNWDHGRVPKGKEGHPVVGVDFDDALAYCRWLGESIGKWIDLPRTAEWEKAARGGEDQRVFPWGDTFNTSKCNTDELGLGATTPVGIFPAGASPHGCLDMVGNVWEWTRSILHDGRRVVRGGSWRDSPDIARCAFRYWLLPDNRSVVLGLRVVLRCCPVSSPLSSGHSGL